MDAGRQFELLRFMRGMIVSQVSELPEEKLLAVPTGLRNNILWNVGHLLFYESVFLYAQSGAAPVIPESYAELFKAGSSPEDWGAAPDAGEVMDRYKTQLDQTVRDFNSGAFDGFKPMQINEAVTLATLEESIAFHCFHEGVHIGRIGTLKSLV